MEIICTRPTCSKPRNFFADLDDETKIRTVQQRYCTNCGMPLLLADRYLPLRLLGKGGFGAAFLARDRYTPTMRLCVVKQFQPSSYLNEQELAVAQSLFEREAVVLEQLGHKHPQIPDLYAFFTPLVPNSGRTGTEQYFYLAQEYIDGQDLETELAAKGKYTEAEVREILTEILPVLQFIHQNNSIHRDIKPSNIMRDRQGVLYLLDFGAVKQIAQGKAKQQKSTGIYSMGFAPPEQMSGSQVYPSTDLYALAATCISLLTGKPAEDLYDSFNHRWNWQPEAPNVRDRLVGILNRMLLPTPAQRFQSAAEVLQELNPTPPTPPASPTPPAPSTPKPSAPIKPRSVRPRFSLTEILTSAAFTGFEGGLLYIGLVSLLSVSGVSLGILGMTLGGLIFAQSRRIIEKIDLVIIAAISAGVIYFLPVLQGGMMVPTIFAIAIMSGAGAVAVTAFFRLVYQLLTRLL